MDNDVFTLTVQVDPVVPVAMDTAQDTMPPVLAYDSFAMDAVTAVTHNPLDDAAPSDTFDLAPNISVDLNGYDADRFYEIVAGFGTMPDFIHNFDGQQGTIYMQGDAISFISV